MKSKGKYGCIFILASGILFTVERYLSVIKWSVLTTPVLTRGNGSYESMPDMPDLNTNLFVIFFLILGVLLLFLDFYDTYKKK